MPDTGNKMKKEECRHSMWDAVTDRKIEWDKLSGTDTFHVSLLRLTADDVQVSHLAGQFIASRGIVLAGCPNLTEIQDIQTDGPILIQDCPNLVRIGSVLRDDKEKASQLPADVVFRNCPKLEQIEHVIVNGNVLIENCPNLSRIDTIETTKDMSVVNTGIREINGNWTVSDCLLAVNNPELEVVHYPHIAKIASFSHAPKLRQVAGTFPDVLSFENCPSLENLVGKAGSIDGITPDTVHYIINQRTSLFQTDDDSWGDLLTSAGYPLTTSTEPPTSGILQWLSTIGQIFLPPRHLSRKQASQPPKETAHIR